MRRTLSSIIWTGLLVLIARITWIDHIEFIVADG